MILEYGNLVAIHAGRVTIMKKDLELVMRIKEVTAAYKTDDEVTGEKAREKKRLALQADQNRKQQIIGLQWQKRRRAEPQPHPSTSQDTSGGHSSDDNNSDDNWSDAPLNNNGPDDSNISQKGGRKSRNRIVDSSDEELEVWKSKDSSSEEDEPVRKKGNGKKSKDSSSEEDELV